MLDGGRITGSSGSVRFGIRIGGMNGVGGGVVDEVSLNGWIPWRAVWELPIV